MRFWDSSALVPLLVNERSSRAVSADFQADPEVMAWWGSEVELVSALARLERDRHLAATELGRALERLDALTMAWREIQPGPRLREIAVRLLRTHPLRAADSLQLAAAIVAAEERPASLVLVTLDARLATAADREGFPVSIPAGR